MDHVVRFGLFGMMFVQEKIDHMLFGKTHVSLLLIKYYQLAENYKLSVELPFGIVGLVLAVQLYYNSQHIDDVN